jgi:hypothetical protein
MSEGTWDNLESWDSEAGRAIAGLIGLCEWDEFDDNAEDNEEAGR